MRVTVSPAGTSCVKAFPPPRKMGASAAPAIHAPPARATAKRAFRAARMPLPVVNS